MNKSLAWIIAFIAAAASFAIAFLIFAPRPHFNWLDFYDGKVEVLKADKTVEPASIKKKLYRDDSVKTHENSVAYIQCGADGLIQLFENTELRLDTLPNSLSSAEDATVVEVIRGGASFFIEKLTDKGSFQAKVAGVRAAVRGTMFHFQERGSSQVVMVSEGAVSVKSDKGAFTEFTVEAGRKAEIEGKEVKVSALGKEDEKYFKNLRELRPVAGVWCAPPEHLERYFRWRLGLKMPEPQKGKAEPGAKKPLAGEENADDPVPASVRLLVTRLTANGVDEAEAETVSQKLFGAVVAAKGADKVLYRAAGERRSANRLLTGRISRLGATRIVAVSVVDGQSGGVLYSKTVDYKEGENADRKFGAVAAEISAQGAVWE
ncbi:MAG: hypothetical protein EPN93_00400 [Spirochaetes bacterium]|nr:MAG: hypothetical protein EPN93_00400 [Spirochaetota bacterium]